MKNIISSLILCLITTVTYAKRINLSKALSAVHQKLVIDGNDIDTNGEKQFVVDQIRIYQGGQLIIKNACILVKGDLIGDGLLTIEDSATLTVKGSRKGSVYFDKRLLADDFCLQTSDQKTFDSLKEVPKGTAYVLYSLDGRLVNTAKVDRYILKYKDSHTYIIKVEGYKKRLIQFNG